MEREVLVHLVGHDDDVVKLGQAHHLSKHREIEDRTRGIVWIVDQDDAGAVGDGGRQLLEILYLRPDQPSYADIAVELDIPIGAIGPTRGRCLAKLRTLLEPAAADEQRDALLLEGSPR